MIRVTRIAAAPSRLCTAEAARGTPLPAVTPTAAGSTRSRPRTHMYRPTAVWNATAAASREVRNSVRPMEASRCGAIANSMLLPAGLWATGTTWLP